MRHLFLCLCLFGLSPQAVAADLDWPLRGPERPIVAVLQWGGVYVGGQFGYGMGRVDLSQAFANTNIFDPNNSFTSPLGQVSSWASTGVTFPSSISYGGFVGYNSIWEEAMLGVELNYNHFGLRGSETSTRCYSDTDTQCASSSLVMGDSNNYNVNITANAEARITDYATFRGRGGWAHGSLMPYAVVGLAVGRVETTRTATAVGTPTGAGAVFTATEGLVNTRFVWGFTAGAGIDVMLMPGVFARAEYEFVQLNDVLDKAVGINSVRVGIGAKF